LDDEAIGELDLRRIPVQVFIVAVPSR